MEDRYAQALHHRDIATCAREVERPPRQAHPGRCDVRPVAAQRPPCRAEGTLVQIRTRRVDQFGGSSLCGRPGSRSSNLAHPTRRLARVERSTCPDLGLSGLDDGRASTQNRILLVNSGVGKGRSNPGAPKADHLIGCVGVQPGGPHTSARATQRRSAPITMAGIRSRASAHG